MGICALESVKRGVFSKQAERCIVPLQHSQSLTKSDPVLRQR